MLLFFFFFFKENEENREKLSRSNLDLRSIDSDGFPSDFFVDVSGSRFHFLKSLDNSLLNLYVFNDKNGTKKQEFNKNLVN